MKARVEQSAEPFEEALRAVLGLEGVDSSGSCVTARTAMRGRPTGRRACPGSAPTSDTETEQDEGGYSCPLTQRSNGSWKTGCARRLEEGQEDLMEEAGVVKILCDNCGYLALFDAETLGIRGLWAEGREL